jgi:hypothetical protein
MKSNDDSSWDSGECSQLNLPFDEERFNEENQEYERRDRVGWLEQNLSFSFVAKRVDDDDEAYFTDVAEREPFRLGHIMTVLGLKCEILWYGIMVKVREKRKIGYVPLADLEVLSKSDSNYWPVREYGERFGNR